MYVCICNGITDTTIREAAARGVDTLEELTMRTGCASGCGSCADVAREILAESDTGSPPSSTSAPTIP